MLDFQNFSPRRDRGLGAVSASVLSPEAIKALTDLLAQTTAIVQEAKSKISEVFYDNNVNMNTILGNIDQQLVSVTGLVENLAYLGVVMNPDTGQTRPATTQDAAGMVKAMQSIVGQARAAVEYAMSTTPANVAANFSFGIFRSLSEKGAQLGRISDSLLAGTESLLVGAGKGAQAVGWILPVAIVGAAGFGLYLLAGVAKSRARRYA